MTKGLDRIDELRDQYQIYAKQMKGVNDDHSKIYLDISKELKSLKNKIIQDMDIVLNKKQETLF